MNTKGAIKFMLYHISDFKERTSDDELVDRDKCNEFLKKANSVISLLQQGEKYRQIVEEIKREFKTLHKDDETGEEYYTGVINKSDIKEIEQKYFPKEAKHVNN